MDRIRLDQALFARGLARSREQGRALIMEGKVLVNGIRAEKAGQPVKEEDVLCVKEDAVPFVSRGGLKLEKALSVFPVSVSGCVCADIGASTGGFTDCILKHGGATVYAIDVGYGQLDWSLRQDPRVRVMERVNARYMEPGWFETPLDFASIDVAFISLDKILPPLFDCLREGGETVALIKPQFEAGREKIGKHGVVSDPAVHREVIGKVWDMAEETGFTVAGLDFSPIRGPKGNIEFLLFLKKFPDSGTRSSAVPKTCIHDVVEQAHSACISD